MGARVTINMGWPNFSKILMTPYGIIGAERVNFGLTCIVNNNNITHLQYQSQTVFH